MPEEIPSSPATAADKSRLDEYLGIISSLDGDEAGRRAAWKRMGEGTAYYHGEPCALSYVPRVWSAQTREWLREVALTTRKILLKVMRRYAEDAAFRREFRFDPRVEELALLETPGPEPLPFARVDILWDERGGDFTFCEFNTDSSSGMDESRCALEAVRRGAAFRRFEAAHALSDDTKVQFEGWVAAFRELYASAGGRAENPRVAIAACFDSPDPEFGELKVYRELFEAAGMPCSVFDVRELSYDNGRLVGKKALTGESNVEIDAVWRYCIVVDLLEHWDEVGQFVRAVREGAAPMFGGFATQVVHDKQLFAVLRGEAVREFLDPAEVEFLERHIPFTAFLDDPRVNPETLKAEREEWVLKPADWYASKNVVVGRSCPQDEWGQLVDSLAESAKGGLEGSGYLAQRFTAPHRTACVPIYGAEGDFAAEPVEFGNIVGLYLIGGDFAGVYVRQGPHDVIGSARAGLVTPVVWVQE